MLTDARKAYSRALQALMDKDYRAASGFFRTAENQFAEDLDFRILMGVTDLLLAVKTEIFEIENEKIEQEEIYSDGQETELR